MKTLETVFTTNQFVPLILVILDDPVELCNQLRQSGRTFVSRLNVCFELGLGALLGRNAGGQCVELFAQIFRRAVIAVGIIASAWIVRIRD